MLYSPTPHRHHKKENVWVSSFLISSPIPAGNLGLLTLRSCPTLQASSTILLPPRETGIGRWLMPGVSSTDTPHGGYWRYSFSGKKGTRTSGRLQEVFLWLQQPPEITEPTSLNKMHPILSSSKIPVTDSSSSSMGIEALKLFSSMRLLTQRHTITVKAQNESDLNH